MSFAMRSSLRVPTVLAAPDKWRGSATANEVAAAVGRAAERHGWHVDLAPVSDGGEGFVKVLGGANRSNRVTGPLGRQVEADWLLRGDEAFIEMAAASGLLLAGGAAANDALAATSRGTGELISAALDCGARRIVVGLGGSASTDGGMGCFEVLRYESRLSGVQIVAACDVMVPLAGALGFAAQKGASATQRFLMMGRLERIAGIYEEECSVDVRQLPGAGAAGGLGAALAALGATLVPGIQLVADAIGLEDRLARADLVVTGEGLLDAQSFAGKAVGWILARAVRSDVPALVIVGDREPELLVQSLAGGSTQVVSLVERFGSDESLSNTLGCIEAVIDERLRR